jgi:homoserine kinase
MHNSFSIKVPASSANLGPGFDSLGIALSLYLLLEVEPSDDWQFTSSSPELKDLPTGESHFICQVVKRVSEQFGLFLTPCRVKMESNIPLARGLGSSAAAIVAGIELANQLGNLKLSKQDKLQIATDLEGHPDNVGASLFGGLVVGSYVNNHVELLSFSALNFEVVAFIPTNTLLTKESRQVLPDVLPFNVAVEASSLGNLLVASLLSENWKLAGEMMSKDIFHQPFRKSLIPFYEDIERIAKENGAFGVALSGAGPTVLAFVEKGRGTKLISVLKGIFMEMDIKLLSIDGKGSYVY